MRKILDRAERDPIYRLEDPYQGADETLLVDVDEALLNRYIAAQLEFNAVQAILAKLRP